MKLIVTLFIYLFYCQYNLIEDKCVDKICVGENVSEFLNQKEDFYDIRKEVISLEGEDSSIYNVYENKNLIYAVEPDENGVIWRIWLYSSLFKTKEKIGVHNTLGDLRKVYSVYDFETGEGNIAILVKEINISFLLDVSYVDDDWWNNMSLDSLSNEIPINFIII